MIKWLFHIDQWTQLPPNKLLINWDKYAKQPPVKEVDLSSRSKKNKFDRRITEWTMESRLMADASWLSGKPTKSGPKKSENDHKAESREEDVLVDPICSRRQLSH